MYATFWVSMVMSLQIATVSWKWKDLNYWNILIRNRVFKMSLSKCRRFMLKWPFAVQFLAKHRQNTSGIFRQTYLYQQTCSQIPNNPDILNSPEWGLRHTFASQKLQYLSWNEHLQFDFWLNMSKISIPEYYLYEPPVPG
jgi:hypothetical protein